MILDRIIAAEQYDQMRLLYRAMSSSDAPEDNANAEAYKLVAAEWKLLIVHLVERGLASIDPEVHIDRLRAAWRAYSTTYVIDAEGGPAGKASGLVSGDGSEAPPAPEAGPVLLAEELRNYVRPDAMEHMIAVMCKQMRIEVPPVRGSTPAAPVHAAPRPDGHVQVPGFDTPPPPPGGMAATDERHHATPAEVAAAHAARAARKAGDYDPADPLRPVRYSAPARGSTAKADAGAPPVGPPSRR